MSLVVGAIFLPFSIFYTYFRFDKKIASAFDAISLLCIFTVFGCIMTYTSTYFGSNIPFIDNYLSLIDGMLGFDWKYFLSLIKDNTMLVDILNHAYLSILYQAVLLIFILSLSGDYKRLQSFIIAFQLSGILCAIFPAVVPAIGAYAFFEISKDIHHSGIDFPTMDQHVSDVIRMRGSNPVIDLDSLEGIVVIPSFHMTLSVIFMWAFWKIVSIRWFSTALNVTMALSTPISGGHYFIDLVAGLLLALAAISVAKIVCYWVECKALKIQSKYNGDDHSECSPALDGCSPGCSVA